MVSRWLLALASALIVVAIGVGTRGFGQSTPTVVLNYSVNSNFSPITPTLTWSSNGVTACTATSSPTDAKWTGSVATSGSLAVGPITVTTIYTLTCTNPTDSTATFSWTAPTLNTDGTNLTDLAGFKLYAGANGTGTLAATINGASTTTYQLTGLSIGTYSWYLTAFNAAGAESGPSNNASKTIFAGTSAAQNVTVQVVKKAAPPANLTVR